MNPVTLAAVQKVAALLTTNDAIGNELNILTALALQPVPKLSTLQVYLSAAPGALTDSRQMISYPRVSIYCNKIVNKQQEKFRSLSGEVSVVSEVAITDNLLDDVQNALHFYVEAVTAILRRSIGDWGDGFFFSGEYEVAVQAPAPGGSGFVQSAKITCELGISRT